MNKIILFIFALVGILLGACDGQLDAGVTPATNKLTFIFFYTDG